MSISPLLTPHDNFPGRSSTRFGVGEPIDLSFAAPGHTSAASLGGLRWFITAGSGTLTGTDGDDGRGLFTAPSSADTVTLVLRIVSGSNAGTIVASVTITIVEPEGAHMVQQPGTGLFHLYNTWSCGFFGDIYLQPKDVSFTNIRVREGTVAAVATGFLAGKNGELHEAGYLRSVGAGNSATGCKVNIDGDDVESGVLGPPYADGDFLWDIPWQFSVGNSALKTFTRVQHHATANSDGKAAVSKGGAGPFSKVPSDSNSSI